MLFKQRDAKNNMDMSEIWKTIYEFLDAKIPNFKSWNFKFEILGSKMWKTSYKFLDMKIPNWKFKFWDRKYEKKNLTNF